MASSIKFWAVYGTLFSSVSGKVLFNPTNDFQPLSGEAPSLPVSLDAILNNRGFGNLSSDADFDGVGGRVINVQALHSKTSFLITRYLAHRRVSCIGHSTFQLRL